VCVLLCVFVCVIVCTISVQIGLVGRVVWWQRCRWRFTDDVSDKVQRQLRYAVQMPCRRRTSPSGVLSVCFSLSYSALGLRTMGQKYTRSSYLMSSVAKVVDRLDVLDWARWWGEVWSPLLCAEAGKTKALTVTCSWFLIKNIFCIYVFLSLSSVFLCRWHWRISICRASLNYRARVRCMTTAQQLKQSRHLNNSAILLYEINSMCVEFTAFCLYWICFIYLEYFRFIYNYFN